MGPLKGAKMVEIGSIGPGPFCAMMLADMGAEIIRIDRKNKPPISFLSEKNEIMNRGRKSIAIDIKKSEGVETVLQLIEKADALIEGFRPGVMERLGLGPDVCFKKNPKLIYGRMTGWGQTGPLAHAAGHDINYISLSGALHAIGRRGDKPLPPLNLVGDFGGGGMFLAFGIACALFEAQKSGQGQVVDAGMVDGSAVLMSHTYSFLAGGFWEDKCGVNILDTGAYFYETYETADNKWISIGSIEPKFYALLLQKAEINDSDFNEQMDQQKWPELKEKIAKVFKSKTRDEWCEIMEGTDVCFAPVLSMTEAKNHPHNVARKTFVEIDGVTQAAPAPRFSRTKAEIQSPPPKHGEHTESALSEWGISDDDIERLKGSGVI